MSRHNWFLADQYIEVSGVPDGYYLLETIADADGHVVETNERNNAASTLIRICGEAAEVVGEQRSCR
jgi:subtilase family serine protease